jgi:RNA polymerase sigma-70 factor (ECF subfamily)
VTLTSEIWPLALSPTVDEPMASTDREIYERHAPHILRFLADVLGNVNDARDGLQETFLRAFARRQDFDRAEHPRAWLFGIARNVSLELRRGRVRRRDLCTRVEQVVVRTNGCDPESAMMGRETAYCLERTLCSLSEPRRAVLLLRIDHGLSYVQIAEIMGWSVAKAKVVVHRARHELRVALAEHLGAREP